MENGESREGRCVWNIEIEEIPEGENLKTKSTPDHWCFLPNKFQNDQFFF